MELTDDHLLSIDDVARAVGQGVKTLRRMIATGEFPDGFPAPRKYRWRWGVVRRWIHRQELLHELAKQKGDKPGHSGTNEADTHETPSQTKTRR